jgi:hypothetical protein
MAVFKDNAFVGQRIQLDGNQFINNKFQNCLLVYGGGALVMRDNTFDNVQWQFTDAAAWTVALISSFYQQGGQSRQFVESLLTNFGKSPEPPTATMPAPTKLGDAT